MQSVHLMISADPVLVPNMSKFKKVQKSNASGKTETAYQCEKCPKQYRTPVALYSKWKPCMFVSYFTFFYCFYKLKKNVQSHMLLLKASGECNASDILFAFDYLFMDETY